MGLRIFRGEEILDESQRVRAGRCYDPSMRRISSALLFLAISIALVLLMGRTARAETHEPGLVTAVASAYELDPDACGDAAHHACACIHCCCPSSATLPPALAARPRVHVDIALALPSDFWRDGIEPRPIPRPPKLAI